MIINELKNRGIFADMTAEDEVNELLQSGEKLTVYCGFDPTADSLHVGSMLPLMNMKRFKDAGHTVIALVGGATGMIGDPSFKDAERSLNTEETVAFFKAGIEKQIVDFLGDDVIVVDNLDWTKNLNVLDFLRDIGKHFSVNAMMGKESVKRRIERDGEGISFTEFSYQLLQGMDFLKLKELFGCNMQIGGSDQMGNITAGTGLIHRVMGNKETAFGLTTKLITKADGTKFGKSESGTIWLDPEKTSPFKFFQFWVNTPDADVYKFLKFFSVMSVEEIDNLEELDKTRRPEAQLILAKELTEKIHGASGLAEALEVTNALFSGDLTALSEKNILDVIDGMSSVEIEEGTSVTIALTDSGLSKSRREAREFVKNNAISANGIKVTDAELALLKENALHEKFIFLKRGKRNLSCIVLK